MVNTWRSWELQGDLPYSGFWILLLYFLFLLCLVLFHTSCLCSSPSTCEYPVSVCSATVFEFVRSELCMIILWIYHLYPFGFGCLLQLIPACLDILYGLRLCFQFKLYIWTNQCFHLDATFSTFFCFWLTNCNKIKSMQTQIITP